MAEPMWADFDSLCAEREALRGFLMSHARSVEAFREEDKPWFRRQEKADEPNKKTKPVRHLTSTASCLQSLHDVPLYAGADPPAPSPPSPEDVQDRREAATEGFTVTLLENDRLPGIWKTESEPLLYTKVRTLPILLSLGNEGVLRKFKDPLKKRTEEVWRVLNIADPSSQGIGEPHKHGEGYPPNAFHTYWAIRLLREYRRWEEDGVLPPLSSGLATKEPVARLWARNTLATQAALINDGRERVDAQQLAWALSTDALCHTAEDAYPTATDGAHADVYRVALRAFFREQVDGHWRLYEPLFHYRSSGNAYCYSYETLAELLRLALLRRSGRLLREQLRPFAGNLVEAWHYARTTAINMTLSGALGWSSGHHPHRMEPEAWATASVFSYLQHLRCLIGYWAAEEARRDLNARPPEGGGEDGDASTLEKRGATWQRDDMPTVAQQMSMLFLHPIKAREEKPDALDPDKPLVRESRSALLFGPPGTGKTTLVKGLAKALGWNFVEVLSSDFLSEGMDQVPKAADRIFKKLMELDHCVILFDEIDELIRVRDDGRSDPFGRFLTTSMLPKLAKLWEQRRVLFFVNTNDIEVADPAIKRSQRFDAAMFVPPPSFEKKKTELKELLDGDIQLEESEVDNALRLEGDSGKADPLGVFALLRWDQLPDLAHRIRRKEQSDASNDSDLLRVALEELGLELAASDWKQADPPPNGSPGSGGKKKDDYPIPNMYRRWSRQHLNERRDRRAEAVVKLDPTVPTDDGLSTYAERAEYLVFDDGVEKGLSLDGDGTAVLTFQAWTGRDEAGIYLFKRVSPKPSDSA
jgi:hypothetical protein